MIRYDSYAVEPPACEWDYAVDGPMPRHAAAGSLRLLEPGRPMVILVPDIARRDWRNETVLVAEGQTLHVRGALFVRARETGGDVVDLDATIIDPAGDARVELFLGATHEGLALRKVRRVLAWWRREMRRRDSGLAPGLTTAELWTDAVRPMRVWS